MSFEPGLPTLLAPTAGLGVVAAGLAWGAFWPRSSLFGGVVSRRPAGLGPLRAAALTLPWDADRRGAGVLIDGLLAGAAALPACVFVSAATAAGEPGVLRELARAGHEIGSRGGDPVGRCLLAGYAHWRRSLDAADDAIADAVGHRPRFFRPPNGIKSPPMLREAAVGGQAAVVWARRLPPLLPVSAAARWTAAAGAGAILDLGPDPLRAAAAFPVAVSTLASANTRIAPLEELLGLA